jgi:hypothetical protein
LLPNGTSTNSSFTAFSNADPTNANGIQMSSTGTEARLFVLNNGTSLSVPMTFYTGGSEAMRITTDRNVGIGTVSPGARIAVESSADLIGSFNGTAANGGYMVWRTSGTTIADIGTAQNCFGAGGNDTFAINGRGARSLLFGTNDQERMRIDSSGNLLVGTTSDVGGSRLVVVSAGNTSATNAVVLRNSSSANLLYLRDDGLINTGLAALSPYNNTTGDAANMVVGSDGFLYRSTSSLKYKTDVQDATHGLAELLSLRPVTYKGKSESDGDKVFGGLIAEEVHEAGLSEFVQYDEEGNPDALAYGNMVSLCIKAIQEQQALIQDLTTRLTTLEGN